MATAVVTGMWRRFRRAHCGEICKFLTDRISCLGIIFEFNSSGTGFARFFCFDVFPNTL